MISFEDFKNLEIVVAQILDVKDHPNADKLYIVTVSSGSGQKQVIAGIKQAYTKEELLGRKVILLDNLEPANIRGKESNGMILAARDKDTQELSILTVDKPVSDGSIVS